MHLDQLARSRLVGADIRNVLFRNFRRHPDLGEVGKDEQFFRSFDDFAFGQIPRNNTAVEWGHHWNVGSDRLVLVQVPQVFIGQSQQEQAIPGFPLFGAETDHFSFTPLRFGQPDDLFLQEQFSPAKRPIGDVQLSRCLEIGRLCHAQLAAIEERQRRAALHLPAQVRIHIDDAPANEW